METATSLSQKTAVVQGFTLFSDLAPADCANIIAVAREKRFLRRQTIFAEGDPVQQIVLLLSGCVKITQIGLSGNEVILRLNGAGEVVGAIRLCADCNHCSSAQAVQPATALVWDAVTFEKLLERYPAFRRNTVRALEERLQEMEQRFREVSTEKVGSRLASELIRLSKRLGRLVNASGEREISLSRAELAQLTGTTLFTVSRLLCRWQTLGIVSIRREAVQVRDVAALTELAQAEPAWSSAGGIGFSVRAQAWARNKPPNVSGGLLHSPEDIRQARRALAVERTGRGEQSGPRQNIPLTQG